MKGVTITRWDKDEIPQVDALKQLLESEGLDPYVFFCYPGDSFDDHKHEGKETRIVAEGTMSFTVDGETVELGVGDRIDLDEGISHKASVIGDKRVLCVSAEH